MSSRITVLFAGPGTEQRLVVFVKTTYVVPQRGPMRRADADSPLTAATESEGPNEWFPIACTERETDLWESKPWTDVVVRGHVHTRHRPLTTTLAGVGIGGREKWLRVFGDRRVEYRRGRPRFTEPEPFDAMKLSWRRAYGGVDLTVPHAEPEDLVDVFRLLYAPEDHPGAYPRNPAGCGWVVNDVPSAIEGMRLPNFETPSQLLTPDQLIVGDRRLWSRAPTPAGFGWWRQGWFPRGTLLGLAVPKFLDDPRTLPEVETDWIGAEQVTRPCPHVNMQSGASPGLRFADLRGGESVVLYGFSRSGPIETCLPCCPPSITVAFEGKRLESRTRLTTVELLPDAGLANLVWVAHARPPVRLPRSMPRVGQRDYELLEGVAVRVDGELVPNETVSLLEPVIEPVVEDEGVTPTLGGSTGWPCHRSGIRCPKK